MKQDQSLKSELKHCLKEWCIDTEYHGLVNIIRADNWIIKFAWLTLVISFTAYCFFSKCDANYRFQKKYNFISNI